MTSQVIYRHKRTKNFSVIDNDIFEQTHISWRARMILLYLLSKPDDWKVIEGDIIKHGPCGRDAVRKSLKELKQAGYIQKVPVRDDAGKISEWRTCVYDEPRKPHEEGGSSRLLKTQSLDYPVTGKSDTTKYLPKVSTKNTHSKREPINSEQSSGVCLTSLEAPQEGNPEVANYSGQEAKAIVKPKPKPTPSIITPLDEVTDQLKSLGIKPSNALRSAAHGRTKDELINACMALEEASSTDGVKSKPGYLVSAFKNCYEPSEDWLRQKEKERQRIEAALREEQRRAEELLLRQQKVEEVRAEVLRLDAAGVIEVVWEKSEFKLDGYYWYGYPDHRELNIRRCDCELMPETAEGVLERQRKIRELQEKVAARNAPKVEPAPIAEVKVDWIPF